MAERSFAREVEDLKLGEGDVFRGEGILAITKALLQSGVSYVGGYQGSPISHLMDVLADAKDVMEDLGVHFETSASEAAAAAMLSASVMYPVRGAVTWKSTAGTNVASDALEAIVASAEFYPDEVEKKLSPFVGPIMDIIRDFSGVLRGHRVELHATHERQQPGGRGRQGAAR